MNTGVSLLRRVYVHWPALRRVPRVIASLVLGLVALLVFGQARASTGQLLGYDDARLLLTRTGFGATDAEVRTLAPLTRAAAVDRLLATTRTAAVTPVPAVLVDSGSIVRPGKDASPEERKAFRRLQRDDGLQLRGWWVQEMLATPSPLTERMTLFWHNHFVSSQQKVRITQLLYTQNALFRAQALGNFGDLLHAAGKDPAMVVYLDSAQNHKGTPNENFAREVMELFTLGEGHYSEQDVKEAARAFTGWSLDRDTGKFMLRPRLHDDGVKSVLGTTGRLDGDAVLDILLAQPATATFITSKLWREFVSPDADPQAVARIAAHFRASRYDIKVVLRDLLTDDAFYAPANRAALVKSPVDIVVGTLHTLQIAPSQPVAFAVASAGMGQNLFAPPNVKGWPGGNAWVNTNTLLVRKQFLQRIAQADKAPLSTPAADTAMMRPKLAKAMDRGVRDLRFDPDEWLASIAVMPARDAEGDDAKARHGGGTDTLLASRDAAALRVLLPRPAVNAAAVNVDAQTLVREALLDPAYQLK